MSVLSLFSGCGGMDLGFEGGFNVLNESVNTEIHPDWVEEKTNDRFIKLKKNNFQTVFANDIREDAQATWINYFGNKGIEPGVYRVASIVDMVYNVIYNCS